MKTSEQIILIITMIMTGVVSGMLFYHFYKPTPEPEVINHYEIDTIYLKDTVFVRYDKYIYKKDSVHDTIEIPIYKHHFDTIIQQVHIGGVLEGWHSNLDSLTIDLPEPVVLQDPRKFGVGVQLGVGFNGEFTPYIGVGISYNLFKF